MSMAPEKAQYERYSADLEAERDAKRVDMHALATARRKVDPDLKYACDSRMARAELRADVAKLRAANESMALELEAARLELAAKPPPAPAAGLSELVALWSGYVLNPGAKSSDALEASRLLADALGITKGGARDTGSGTAEAVSAVVLESAAIAARAAERDRTRARMVAAGMDAATIAAILGEGESA